MVLGCKPYNPANLSEEGPGFDLEALSIKDKTPDEGEPLPALIDAELDKPVPQFESGRLAGTIHGSPVDSNLRYLPNVTQSELTAFLAGSLPMNPSGLPVDTGHFDQGFYLAPGDTPYMLECRNNGVSIPPDWGDPKWTKLGELPRDRIFALNAGYKTEVYQATDPNGICVALPRTPPKGDAEWDNDKPMALGIICQNKNNGKACFWDNVDVKTKAKVRDPASIKPRLMSDGSNLQENCTGCHRGDNVFIVHKGTVLEDIDDREPAVRYSVISGQVGWANPPDLGPAATAVVAPQRDCQRCHGIPELSPEYCQTVLISSINVTMPPNPKDNMRRYLDSARKLLDLCRPLLVPGGAPP